MILRSIFPMLFPHLKIELTNRTYTSPIYSPKRKKLKYYERTKRNKRRR